MLHVATVRLHLPTMKTGKNTPLGTGRATANAVNSSCKIEEIRTPNFRVTCMYTKEAYISVASG